MDKNTDMAKVKLMSMLVDMAYECGLHQDDEVPMEVRTYIAGQKVVRLISDIAEHGTEDDLHMMIQLIDALEERIKNYE